MNARYQRYEKSRVQVVQIKCLTGSDEHREIQIALKRLQNEHGYKSVREAFVESLLKASMKIGAEG